MFRKLALALTIGFIPSAFASSVPFKSLQCSDANSSAQAPVLLTVEGTPDSTGQIRFKLGQIVPINPANPQQGTYDDVTLYGDITATDVTSAGLELSGSFGFTLSMKLAAGSTQGPGVLNGEVKYDPATGQFVDGQDLTNYSLNCQIQR